MSSVPLSALHHRLATSHASPIELTGVLIAVFAVGVWAAVIRDIALGFIPPTEPFLVLNVANALMYVGGVVVATIVYTRLREFSIETGLPRPMPAGVAAVLAPIAFVAVGMLATATLGVDVVEDLFSPNRFAPVVPEWYVIANASSNAAWFAVGYALLVCGVVYETLRHHVAASERDALVLTAILCIVIRFFPVSVENLTLLVSGSLASTVPTQLVLNAFGMVAAFCVAGSLGIGYYAYCTRDATIAVSPWYVPVYAVTGAALFLLAVDPFTPVEELFYVTALASAAVGYARTESIWVAITTLFLFELLVQVALVV